MVDINDYPGAVDAINKLLSVGRVAEVQMDIKVENGISVSEHARYFVGVYTPDKENKSHE